MRTFILFLLLTFSFGPLLLSAEQPLEDGPYLQWKGDEATVYRCVDSKWVLEHYQGEFRLALPGIAARELDVFPRSPEPGPGEIVEPEKFLAISDIHGNFNKFKQLLEAHGVIDGECNWIYGTGHLIICGDIADKGSHVTECFWLTKLLEQLAHEAGGEVHFLLGNHESDVMSGKYTYTYKKYLNTKSGLPSISDRFSERDEIWRWVRRRPALLKAGRFLFAHAGISSKFLASYTDTESCNKDFLALKSWSKHSYPLLLGNNGPLCYSNFTSSRCSNRHVERVVETFGVSHVVVGHKIKSRIEWLKDGKIIAIDAGISKGNGEVLIWENKTLYRGLVDGSRELLY